MTEITALPRIPQESTREYVYRALKSYIMDFTLPPGSALSEKEIAILLSVSRTPVREAFIQLAQERLLDIMPQKGTYVSLIDLGDVEESRFLRETLETAIMKIACHQFPKEMLFELQSHITIQELCFNEKQFDKFFALDEDIHRVIFAGCNKTRTWAMMQQMHGHYNRVRWLNVTGGGYDLLTILEQHTLLVQAIREGDEELGMRTLHRHLNKVLIDVNDLRQQYRDYFKA
jgi:DNA-binding GntR family transcriptional regulator